ncbi:MAG: DinB family protein, partial [Pseudomonadales bacterium]
MARNNHWSNYRLYTACGLLPERDYFAQRSSFFGSLHATLNHILIVDLMYLGRLPARELVPLDCEELHSDVDSLRTAQRATDRELIEFCVAQTSSSLSALVSFKRADGQDYTESVARLLSHLFVHQVHHRGQVHDMLSATGVPPPQLDEFFLSGDLALREQELAELGFPR